MMVPPLYVLVAEVKTTVPGPFLVIVIGAAPLSTFVELMVSALVLNALIINSLGNPFVPAVNEPPVIVLDEPNSNLDEAGENALRTTIQQLKAQGKTVVLITHRLGVLNTTDKIMELRQGTVHWYGPREDFAQRAVASTQLSATAN